MNGRTKIPDSISQAAKKGGKSRREKDAAGYDAGQKAKGRKLHALVGVEGLPLGVVVHTAGMQDRDGGDTAHEGKDAVAKSPGLRLQIVKRSDDVRGSVISPRRCIVERTFSWFGRNRRLAKDYETLADALAAFVALAAIQFGLGRLARS